MGKAPDGKFCKFRNLFANSESQKMENYFLVLRIQAVTVVPMFCLNVALKVL